MARHSKFKNYVSQLAYSDPDNMLNEFREEMNAAAAAVGASLENTSILLDNKRHYLKSLQGRNDQKQYYKASISVDKDGTVWPAVTFGSFYAHYDNVYFKPRNAVFERFKAAKESGGVVEDLASVQAYQERNKEIRQQARLQQEHNEALLRDAQEAARQVALEVIADATTQVLLNSDNPPAYFVKKGFTQLFGDVRIATREVRARLYNINREEWITNALVCLPGDLIIPMYDMDPRAPGICNFQRIDSQCNKRFVSGGKVSETYHLIPGNESRIIATEGWATGQTVRMLSGQAVMVAWSGGNLENAVVYARDKWPDTPIVTAADNDWETAIRRNVKNPGLKTAQTIQDNHGVHFAAPEFNPELDFGCSDWDDFRIRYGNNLAAKRLNEGIDQAAVTWLRQYDTGTLAAERDAANNYLLEYPDPDKQYIDLNKVLNPTCFEYQNTQGKPTAVNQNIAYMMRQYGACARYNKITKDIEIVIPGSNYSVDNEDNAGLEEIRNLALMNSISTDGIESKLLYLADANTYNPVADWIESKPWDGVDRLWPFIRETVIPKEGFNLELRDILISRWMIGAVALAYNDNQDPSFMAKGILVFQGGQSIGKTSWFKALVSDAMARYVKDGLHLDPNNKDSLLIALKHWIVELGELEATTKKVELAKVKAFTTQNKDSIRKPFARRDSTMPRRTAFFGSVNEHKFLVDETGNARFWTIEVERLNFRHDFDMQQVWAQVASLYRSGAKYWLDGREANMLDASNADFESIDPYEEAILRHFMIDVEYGETGKTYKYDTKQQLGANEVLTAIGYDKPSRADSTRMGNLLKKMFGNQKKTNRGMKYPMPWKRPISDQAS